MAERAVTVTVAVTSGVVNSTLGAVGQYQFIRVTNSGANSVWFNDFSAAAAVAGADENTFLPSGQSMIIPYVASMTAIAITAGSTLTLRGLSQPFASMY